MAEGSGQYHEAQEKLSASTKEMHRALRSLMEELEAVDWYQQRVDATQDDGLRAILIHNRDEELEHAAMVLEWLRRNNPKMDKVLSSYLFTQGDITKIEENTEQGGGGSLQNP